MAYLLLSLIAASGSPAQRILNILNSNCTARGFHSPALRGVIKLVVPEKDFKFTELFYSISTYVLHGVVFCGIILQVFMEETFKTLQKRIAK